jgi:hypothetical protein
MSFMTAPFTVSGTHDKKVSGIDLDAEGIQFESRIPATGRPTGLFPFHLLGPRAGAAGQLTV